MQNLITSQKTYQFGAASTLYDCLNQICIENNKKLSVMFDVNDPTIIQVYLVDVPSNTTYTIDQPKVSVPPHGWISMGRTFQMQGVGRSFLHSAVTESPLDVNNSFSNSNTYAASNIGISYSIDNETTYQFIETHLFANSLLVGKVREKGKVNDALRTIYMNKPDALSQPWFLLYFASKSTKENDSKLQPYSFVNYQ